MKTDRKIVLILYVIVTIVKCGKETEQKKIFRISIWKAGHIS